MSVCYCVTLALWPLVPSCCRHAFFLVLQMCTFICIGLHTHSSLYLLLLYPPAYNSFSILPPTVPSYSSSLSFPVALLLLRDRALPLLVAALTSALPPSPCCSCSLSSVLSLPSVCVLCGCVLMGGSKSTCL